MPEPAVSAEETSARAKLGRWLVGGGLAVILVLGGLAIGIVLVPGQVDKDKFGHVKDIISIFLPVVAAWVGSVLAFYFSKENFVAASEKAFDFVRQLTPDQKLQTVPVASVMIAIETATKLKTDKAEKEIKLQADILQGLLAKKDVNRVPIVSSKLVVRYILHRSMFDRFVAAKALEKPQPDLEALTLEDMLKADDYRRVALAFGTVKKDAHLAAVKATIDGNPECSDVFVTEDGAKSDPAVCWITNVIVAEKARL